MNLILIFNSIRDIPYKIPLSPEDPAIDCAIKHQKLSLALSQEGYQTRFRICSFLWSSLSIPPEILNIPHEDECEHLFLEVLINGRWCVLDATWDSGLRSLFTINNWDGRSDTEIAVNPIKIFPPQTRPLAHTASKEAFFSDLKKNGDFYAAVNEWLEENRV